MTSVIALAQELSDLATRVNHQERLEELHRRAAVARQRTDAARGRLAPAVAYLKSVASVGADPALQGALAAIHETRCTLDDLASALEDPTLERILRVDDVLVAIEGSIATAESLGGLHWRAVVAENVSAGRVELLEALLRVPNLATRVRPLIAIVERLERIAKKEIPSPEDAENFRVEGEAFASGWAALHLEAPGVQEFLLAAVSPNGAPLTTYTESVQNWLAEHGLVDVFVVRPGYRR